MVERCGSPLGPETEPAQRMFFEAVLYRARTGVAWRDLPGDFGAGDAAYDRLRRGIHSGRLERPFRLRAERPGCEGPRRLMIDSTTVRAHQHAAGARRQRRAARRRRPAARAAG